MTAPIVKDWRGLPVYGCPQCQFDSHDQAVVREHIQWIHKPKGQPIAVAPAPAPVVKRVKVEPPAMLAVNGEDE
jgi:hypothetical protein